MTVMEGAPLHSMESDDENEEILADQNEVFSHEKQELFAETGHIAVNPLADGHDFSVTDDEDDDDNV